ncbi:Pate10 [Phodopus roborovskii]|uniref:Pate10 protein n=1 Tax=Phodopus roborovskii TaxID=109678 RepID=A0AAU9ZVY0_PHORO|nr:Pate10 [Phodopus roborovskii]
MDWLLILLLPRVLLVLCESHAMGEYTLCTSCNEYFNKTCKKNSGVCQPRYPDFACQTKEVYFQLNTGEYLYKYSTLGCPRRCMEYIRFIRLEKHIFSCCNQSYCNSLPEKNILLP